MHTSLWMNKDFNNDEFQCKWLYRRCQWRAGTKFSYHNLLYNKLSLLFAEVFEPFAGKQSGGIIWWKRWWCGSEVSFDYVGVPPLQSRTPCRLGGCPIHWSVFMTGITTTRWSHLCVSKISLCRFYDSAGMKKIGRYHVCTSLWWLSEASVMGGCPCNFDLYQTTTSQLSSIINTSWNSAKISGSTDEEIGDVIRWTLDDDGIWAYMGWYVIT